MLALAVPVSAAAQELAAGPATTTGRRLTIAGEAAVTVSPDDHAYFNYSTEAYSLLRLVRLDGSATVRLGSRLSLLGDLRVQAGIGEGSVRARPYALFARIHP